MKKLFPVFLLACCAALLWICSARAETETVLALSDTHLTKNTQDHASMMQAVIHAAAGKDLVLMTGDNTNNSRPEEHELLLQWAGMIEEQTGAEVYILPGNHDYGAYFGPDRFIAQYGAYGWDRAFSRDSETAGYAVMTAKGTCLLMIDTNHADTDRSFLADGLIGEPTLNWIRKVLESLPDGTPVIACGHHPILPAERDRRTPGAGDLSRLLRSFGVGLYLCGHDHGFATVEEEGLRQITLGQPQAYPGWTGVLQREEAVFRWRAEPIYGDQSPALIKLREEAYTLSRNMARGTLEPTAYAGDEAAVEWFSSVFMLALSGEMTPESRAALLADENCRKWRQIETRTVVKTWILQLLEKESEDLRELALPPSVKHAPPPRM